MSQGWWQNEEVSKFVEQHEELQAALLLVDGVAAYVRDVDILPLMAGDSINEFVASLERAFDEAWEVGF